MILTTAYTNDIDMTMKQKQVDVPSIRGDRILDGVEKNAGLVRLIIKIFDTAIDH